MGEVYKARDTRLDRIVALKVSKQEFTERFEREARAVAALNHPNICTLHDVGPNYLVMELVEGIPLKGPLPVEEAVEYAEQILDALDAAHSKGITHRDLKPANILVTKHGIKLLDFGLATRNTPRTEIDETITEALTGVGQIVGTPRYMSPEQARGEEVDARSDLFSFGAVLYEMTTGKQPFPGNNSAVIFEGILGRAPVPPRQLNPQVPEELERIITKALEKDRDLRAQAAAELRSDLKRLQRSLRAPSVPVTAAAPPARRQAGPGLWLAAAIGGVVVALAGWYVLSQRVAPPSWKNATFTQLTGQAGQELSPSLSPDGKSFVYASRSSGNWDIYFQRVGGETAINLTRDSPADDTHPAISPDGERIAFRSERGAPSGSGGIFVMGATGESVKRLTDFGYNPAWSPDGTEIVCATASFRMPHARQGNLQSQLFRVKVSTGEKRLITPNRLDAVEPRWSPHGRRLAFWGLRQGSRDIWTIPASGGEPVAVTNDNYLDWNPLWSPDGQYLHFSSDRGGSMNLWRVRVDETSGKLLGPLEPVTTPSSYSGFMSLSRDGKRLAYVQQATNFNLYKVAFDPSRETVVGQPVPITQGSRGMVEPDPSPDDQWLTFRTWGKREDIFVVRADGTGLRQLTDDVHFDRRPRWSPEGKKIAFYSNRTGGWQVWVINPDGSGLQQLTYETRANVTNPVWSPDATRLAYGIMDVNSFFMEVGKSWGGQSPQAWLGSGPDTYVLPDSWSPDGRKLAGTLHHQGASARGIAIYSVERQELDRLTDRGLWPQWLSDSRRLLFSDSGALHLTDSRSKRIHEVLNVTPHEVTGRSVPSRDDRWIYFTLRATEADVWLATME